MKTQLTLAALLIAALAGAPLASNAADDSKSSSPPSAMSKDGKEGMEMKPHSHMQERLGAGADTKPPKKSAKKPRKDVHQHQRDMK